MKNTFTFPHDFGARNDPELQRLIFDLGPAAGWAYWVAVEMLYEQGGRMPKKSYNQIAYAAHVSEDIIKTIVEDSSLFKTDKTSFWSRRVEFTLENKENKSNKNKTAAQIKWAKWKKDKELQEQMDADAMRTQSEISANAERTLCHNNNNNSNNNSNNNTDIDSSLHSESISSEKDEPRPPVKENVLNNKQCQQVADFWNRTITEQSSTLPLVKTLSEDRKNKIRIRWKEFSAIGDPVEVCRTLFTKAAESKFLQGDNAKGWNASFDWLFTNGKNWVKVLEGNYDDKTAHPKTKGEKMWDNIRKNLEVLPFNEDGTINL